MPIAKMKDETRITNFRPIILISNIAKILEKYCKNQINLHIPGRQCVVITEPVWIQMRNGNSGCFDKVY